METNNQPAGGETTTNQNQTLLTTSKNIPMAYLAYIGPLVIVSYLVAKDDPFVKFHIKQGLVLFVIEVVVWFFGSMFYSLDWLLRLIDLALLVFSIIGLINVAHGKDKELPWIGQFARYFPI